MKNIIKKLGIKSLSNNEDGLEMLEYGILAAAIVLVAVAGYKLLGSAILNSINNVVNVI